MSIAVYARNVNSSIGFHLATCETVDDIDNLISHMRKSGVNCDGETVNEFNTQYVIDDDSAFFEIIVG